MNTRLRFGWISRYVIYKAEPHFVRLIVRVNVERLGLNFSKEKKEIVAARCVIDERFDVGQP